MITVLIAYGPNSIEIPCRLFETREKGHIYCDKLFSKIGVEPKVKGNGIVHYYADMDEIENDEVSNELFTSHYYGCGWPNLFVLKVIPFNEKFVPFDLD